MLTTKVVRWWTIIITIVDNDYCDGPSDNDVTMNCKWYKNGDDRKEQCGHRGSMPSNGTLLAKLSWLHFQRGTFHQHHIYALHPPLIFFSFSFFNPLFPLHSFEAPGPPLWRKRSRPWAVVCDGLPNPFLPTWLSHVVAHSTTNPRHVKLKETLTPNHDLENLVLWSIRSTLSSCSASNKRSMVIVPK